MGILALRADERVANVSFSEDSLCEALMDGRTISVPLAWYPKLLPRLKNSAKIGKSPAPGMASIGLTWTKTLAPKACSEARPHAITQLESSVCSGTDAEGSTFVSPRL